MQSWLTAALAGAAPAGEGGLLGGLLQSPLFPLLLMVAVMYFLLFAPMRKKQKAHADMLAALKIKDRVVTQGGIYGTVVGIQGDKLQLRIAEKVTIDVSRSAVAALQETE